MNQEPIVLVLASGAGTRFLASGGAGNKLHAILQGRSILDHTLAAVADSGLQWRVVTDVEGGMGDTIAAGVNASRDAWGWLILPGDLPLVTARSIRSVAACLGQHQAVAPSWKGQKGHPVGFRYECLDLLRQLSGPSGAGSLLKTLRESAAVLDLPLEDQGICMDIDTVEDLSSVECFLQQRSAIGTTSN